MTPEELARQQIDALLEAAGWVLQNNAEFNRNAGEGVAVREFSLPNGPCDYLLFVGGKAAGVIEAKKAGVTLSGVAEQSAKYMQELPRHLARWADRLSFHYESTGEETFFRDTRDPQSRSRRVFAFHQPKTLHAWLKEADTLRGRLQQIPPLDATGLRDCQIDAVRGLEASLVKDQPRALIQMATGAGKTFTACTFSWRLLKFSGARRILFLVDRNNLGDQTLKEYGDYVEQITFLLFLKMDQERSELLGEPSIIPAKWRWGRLANLAGDDLELQYRHTLENLAKEKGLIGTIFRKAQNKLTDPAKLKRVVSLIHDETWIGIGVDVKGAIYEGLLERNAAEVKSGAGQYFTPRPLIQAMVKVVNPKIGETIHDPSCGTGGFLLATYDHMKGQSQDRSLQRKLREKSLSGVDIVDEVVRLCGMNLYLHGIGNGESPIHSGDALATDPGERYNVILTNPPFGKKSSYKVIGEDGEVDTEREDYEREDFKFTTSNKQINFLQHIMTIMETGGRAGVVLPDNVLFEAGSAGEGIRERLLKQFDFHTLMRLPTGIFYKPGVKANVLFFDKHAPRADGKPNSKAVWIYDFRTNMHFTLRKNTLKPSDLDDFVKCYSAADRSKRKEDKAERFKRFAVDDLLKRDKLNMDITWLKDDSLDDMTAFRLQM